MSASSTTSLLKLREPDGFRLGDSEPKGLSMIDSALTEDNALMQIKDKQYLANVFNKITKSVNTVNAEIIARQQGKVSVDDLLTVVAMEQLAMQHEILIVLATLVADPSINVPELPTKKITGFN
jgi:hypothetical protein